MKYTDAKDFETLLSESATAFERVKTEAPAKTVLVREGARTYTETVSPQPATTPRRPPIVGAGTLMLENYLARYAKGK